jgi:serine protease AprX
MCPDIKLFDFRVVGHSEADSEFAVMGVLQYIKWLNERNNYMVIHGVNMSLSLPYDVRNYACGQTPVCKESERLVDSGVVVVVAAGNQGYSANFSRSDKHFTGFQAISVTDPGNAEKVITVGATHGNRPHTYGVSFFSGRSPTGDGRLKPDLVAPGEKILAPGMHHQSVTLDGTSMVAPHVSGAAAMLMARHREFIGNPEKIKKVLVETATDLGRERAFQGHGMLDILRAIQSV